MGTQGLSEWIASIGAGCLKVSNRVAYFKSEILKNLTEDTLIKHHFTTAYCPWANRAVERPCKEVLKALRAQLYEWEMWEFQWPLVIDCIRCIIYQSTCERSSLSKSACDAREVWRHLETLTGIRSFPMIARTAPIVRFKNYKWLAQKKVKASVPVDVLQKSFQKIQRNEARQSGRESIQAQHQHGARTYMQLVNFIWRLRHGSLNTEKRHKLSIEWQGRMWIVEVKADIIFEVENFTRTHPISVQPQRRTPYLPLDDGELASAVLTKKAKPLETPYHIVEYIKGNRRKNGKFELEIKWVAWEIEDQIWTICIRSRRTYLA